MQQLLSPRERRTAERLEGCLDLARANFIMSEISDAETSDNDAMQYD